MMPRPLVIGTRGSPLALAQANATRDALVSALGLPSDSVRLDILVTTGDAILDRPLGEAGGKGLFTKEIDAAQLSGRVDLAVHSAKDLPTALPDGLMLAGTLPREDVRDVFVGRDGRRFAELPEGAMLGSASLRRQAQARRLRPDLAVTLLRGNVGTRLAKVARGEVDGTFLALAGLKRLGLADPSHERLDPEHFLPAPGQGAIALVIRTDDDATRAAVAAIACAETGHALAAERAFLAALDGSCRTPIAGHAHRAGGRWHFRGEALSADGAHHLTVARDWPDGASLDEAAAQGRDAGEALRRAARGTPLAALFGDA